MKLVHVGQPRSRIGRYAHPSVEEDDSDVCSQSKLGNFTLDAVIPRTTCAMALHKF